jgi:hypothetical protein
LKKLYDFFGFDSVDEPRKPFSWADLASKGTSRPVSQQIPSQPQQQSMKSSGFGTRQEVKQDTSPTAPKEQRAPRLALS